MKTSYFARISRVCGLICVCVMLLGCASNKPLERIKRDSTYISNVVHDTLWKNTIKFDSIYIHDSIISYIDTAGTRYVDRWHEKIKYKFLTDTAYVTRWKTDYIYIDKVDSVRVPVPVERKLTKWEKVKQDIGGIAIGAILCVIGYILYKLYRKYHHMIRLL